MNLKIRNAPKIAQNPINPSQSLNQLTQHLKIRTNWIHLSKEGTNQLLPEVKELTYLQDTSEKYKVE